MQNKESMINKPRLAAMAFWYAETGNIAEVGRVFGLSRERVRVILTNAGIDTSHKTKEPDPKHRVGRPRSDHARPRSNRTMRRVRATISSRDSDAFTVIGMGNRSLGIRTLIDGVNSATAIPWVPYSTKPTIRVDLSLRESDIEWLRWAGDDNLSVGLRRLAAIKWI